MDGLVEAGAEMITANPKRVKKWGNSCEEFSLDFA
jgi:hypothetical protein